MTCPKIDAGSCKPHCHFFEVVCIIITERHTRGIFSLCACRMVNIQKINNGGTGQVYKHCIAMHLNLPNLMYSTFITI